MNPGGLNLLTDLAKGLEQFSWNDRTRLLWTVLLPVFCFCVYNSLKILKARINRLQLGLNSEWTWSFLPKVNRQKFFALSFAYLMLIIALAGPRLGWKLIEQSQKGMDIVVAVDVSKSMLAEDISPNRLERARRMIIDLLDVSRGDRIGLVFFAGAAFVQCPLTADHDAVRSFLDRVDTDLISVGGTNFSEALDESLRALGIDSNQPSPGNGKLIVIMSDGEDHEKALDQAIDRVAASKAKVIAVGLGTATGAPIPNKEGGFIKDNNGNVVISKMDDALLKSIADKTGGYYISASQVDASVASVYENIITKFGTVHEFKNVKAKIWYERYQWPAALALALLLFEIFLVEIKRVNVLLCLIVSSMFFVSTNSEAASDVDRYNDTVSKFDESNNPGEQIFQELAKSANPEVSRRSLYNLGNILAKKGKFDDAIKMYEAALALNTQDQQVRENLKWVKERASQEQQKSEQQKSEQQKSEQQKSEQQKSEQQQKHMMTEEDVDRLLRSVPDDSKKLKPAFRGEKSTPRNLGRDW